MLGVVARSDENNHEIQNKRCNEKCLSAVPNFGRRFTCMSKIGCGTFGEVWRAFDNDNQNWVAVKTFQEVCSDHLGVNMMVIREISLLRKLSHPNITKTLDVLIGDRISSESLLLVMVKSDSSSLFWRKNLLNRQQHDVGTRRHGSTQLSTEISEGVESFNCSVYHTSDYRGLFVSS